MVDVGQGEAHDAAVVTEPGPVAADGAGVAPEPTEEQVAATKAEAVKEADRVVEATQASLELAESHVEGLKGSLAEAVAARKELD